MSRLSGFGWFVLVYNVAVIVFGAFVRATGSGAGCGRSWPTCNPSIDPEGAGARTIELLHRGSAGVALLLVLALAIAVWRRFPTGHLARKGSLVAVLAIVGEALIGAMIVLAEWVAHDDSVARAIAVPLHLVNTLLLLGALALTIHWISGGPGLDFADRRRSAAVLLGGLAIVLISASGAVTALADTLFPKEGLSIDLSEGAHFLTRLRVVHPILAVVAAAAGWWAAGRARSVSTRWRNVLVGLVGAMLLSGVANIWLGVPVWMQLVHLAGADALWVTYVLASASAMAEPAVMASRLSPSR